MSLRASVPGEVLREGTCCDTADASVKSSLGEEERIRGGTIRWMWLCVKVCSARGHGSLPHTHELISGFPRLLDRVWTPGTPFLISLFGVHSETMVSLSGRKVDKQNLLLADFTVYADECRRHKGRATVSAPLRFSGYQTVQQQ